MASSVKTAAAAKASSSRACRDERPGSKSELREKERAYRALFNTCPDGIVVASIDGTILEANQALLDLLGYSSADLLHRSYRDITPAKYHKQEEARFSAFVAGGRAVGAYEKEYVRKDGSLVPVALTIWTIRDDAGRTVRFGGFVRDITDRKRLEQELLQVRDLEQRRIGQDLHDTLGQELVGISYAAQSLARQMSDTGHPATERAEHLVRLLQDAQAQARRIAHGLAVVDPAETGLAVALERLAADTEALYHVRCKIHLARHVRVRDNLVATNLFCIAKEAAGNAVRHGRATQIEIHLRLARQRGTLMIKDNGCGMPPARPEASRGMGLRIMRFRADMLGGVLCIEPRRPSGTSVICRFVDGKAGPSAAGANPWIPPC